MALTDTDIHTPPEYGTLAVPAAGGTYVDPVFGTTIKRLTDATARPPDGITPVYSKTAAYSLDNKWLLLFTTTTGMWQLYDTDGNWVRELSGFGEYGWSRLDEDVFYYPLSNQVRTYNAATNQHATHYTFGQYGSITFGKGESDLSDNERTTIIGDFRYVCIFDLATLTEHPVFDIGGVGFSDGAQISPSGDGFIVQWNAPGSARNQGVEYFDQDAVFQHQLLNGLNHMDMGRDELGRDCIYAINLNTTPPTSTPGIIKVLLSDASTTLLLDFGDGHSVHVSGRALDGWAYIGSYGSGYGPAPPWYPYSHEIYRVRGDGSVIERLCHHRSSVNSYWQAPRPVISMDGTRLVYSSDFMQSEPGDYVDTYEIRQERKMALTEALGTLLDTDARYDAAVRAGSNGLLVGLLNEIETGSTKIWDDIPVDDFLDAIAGESLTVQQEARIQTYTQARSVVPTSRANVRTWIQAQGLSPATLNALKALAEREQTYSEGAGIARGVSLAHVRRAVRRVAKSFIVSTGQADLET